MLTLGIAIGLALYGPKLIRTVGTEITELDQMRAFSVAMAAAITVIIASQMGLPVSSTHIAVGAIFGVGFLREYLKTSYAKMEADIIEHHSGQDHKVVEEFLDDFRRANVDTKGILIKLLKSKDTEANSLPPSRRISKNTPMVCAVRFFIIMLQNGLFIFADQPIFLRYFSGVV